MEISELIRKFNISLHGENQLKVWNKPNQKEMEELKAKKAEIIVELKARQERRLQLQKEQEEKERKELEEEMKKPLFFTKENVSYFACDQSWDITILSESRRLTPEEKTEFENVHALAEKMGKTETMPHIVYTGCIHGYNFPDGNLSIYQILECLKKMPEYEVTMKKEEEKAKVTEEKNKQYEEKKEKALAEAKATGKNVVIRVLGCYDGDGDREAEKEFGKECGVITVYETATPDGRIIETRSAAY